MQLKSWWNLMRNYLASAGKVRLQIDCTDLFLRVVLQTLVFFDRRLGLLVAFGHAGIEIVHYGIGGAV